MSETRTRPDWTVHTGNVVAFAPRPLKPPMVAQTAGLVEAALDALGQGVAILDADGQLQHANAMLRGFAAQEDGLALTERGIASADESAQSRLRDAVWRALAAAMGEVRVLPGAVRIALPRSYGGAPWLVQVIALPPGGFSDAAGAMLVVSDPGQRRLPSPAHLHAMLGLTEAEAQLALALASGATPAGERRALAGLRRRTGCRTTAEIVALVLGL
jgi:hypothetical protein